MNISEKNNAEIEWLPGGPEIWVDHTTAILDHRGINIGAEGKQDFDIKAIENYYLISGATNSSV